MGQQPVEDFGHDPRVTYGAELCRNELQHGVVGVVTVERDVVTDQAQHRPQPLDGLACFVDGGGLISGIGVNHVESDRELLVDDAVQALAERFAGREAD